MRNGLFGKTKLASKKRLVIYLFLIVWTLTEMVPITWMFYSSLKTTSDFLRNPWSLPVSPTLANYYVDLIGGPQVYGADVGRYLINSTIVSFSSVALIVLLSVPTGYVLAKRTRFTTWVFYVFLALICIPLPAVVIPIALEMRGFGLFNTLPSLILPYVAFNLPFSIVLSRAFFKSFPRELEESGRMDGLGDLGVFVRIVLPLSVVILVVVAIVNFPNVWNELLLALVLVPNNNVKTIQPGILLFIGTFFTNWGNVFAALVLSSLPMIITYIVFQRYIIKGLVLGAIKE